MEDVVLIELLRNQEQNAYRVLVERYEQQVYHTCLGFLHHREDALDAAQEVFLEIFRSIKKFKGHAQLSTWIYRISVNKSLEQLRKKQTKKRKSFLKSLLGEEDQYEPADHSYHPGVALENKERAEVLFSHIQQLPENQKIAFTLNKVDGLSYQEIAGVMETSVSSVESLLHRAKKNLQKSLHHYYSQEM